MKKQETPICQVCNRKPKDQGEEGTWQCSHVSCPNRRQLTAAPNDRPPLQSEFDDR